MGIKHYVFVINKMDIVNYDERVFEKIKKDINDLMEDIEYDSLFIIPVSATKGDNITSLSDKTPWYDNVPLLEYLENIDTESESTDKPFVMPVQRVCRPDYTFRGFQGQIEEGVVNVGDSITSLPSGETALVKEIYVCDKQVDTAVSGQPVTIVIDREMDISRGCVIVNADSKAKVSNLFRSEILWMDDTHLQTGKSYYLKIGTKKILASVTRMCHSIDINTGKRKSCESLSKNEIGVCEIMTADKVVLSSFDKINSLGCFILIDSETNMTSACGVVRKELRREDNVVWQNMDVTRQIRERELGQEAKTIWFTGLSGAGKSTLANALEKRLLMLGKHTMILDGDNIRHGLNSNLSFGEEDRAENIRRIAEAARLLNDAGIIVMVSVISPFAADRKNAADIIGEAFTEVYVSTPKEECAKRDVKGLYAKAERNEITNFTGVNSPYEKPRNADIVIDTTGKEINDCVDELMKLFV